MPLVGAQRVPTRPRAGQARDLPLRNVFIQPREYRMPDGREFIKARLGWLGLGTRQKRSFRNSASIWKTTRRPWKLAEWRLMPPPVKLWLPCPTGPNFARKSFPRKLRRRL